MSHFVDITGGGFLMISSNTVKLLRCCMQVTVELSEDLCLPEQRPEDVDVQVLRNVRRTSARSCALMSELKTLKSKVYGLENDLRHL